MSRRNTTFAAQPTWKCHESHRRPRRTAERCTGIRRPGRGGGVRATAGHRPSPPADARPAWHALDDRARARGLPQAHRPVACRLEGSRALPGAGVARDAARARGSRAGAQHAQARWHTPARDARRCACEHRCRARRAAAARRGDAEAGGVRAAARASRGVPLLRRPHRARDGGGTRHHGAHGAARLGEGTRAASARARVLSPRTMGGIELPDDWAELASLVDLLLDAAPEQRPALIAELSGNDATRRAALERLLAECERESPLFDRPATERFASLFADDFARFPAALAERYRLTHELGRGGMASVFLARDLKHGRDVAVKVVHPMVASVLGAERFLREVRMMAQLRHPHIVPLFDSGEADGALYYVMPYEPGPSLRQRAAKDGQLPLDDVVSILRDVCDALAYAHQGDVVHR